MASVTFPAAYGGDGKTYTDDADPTTGLANGGHRLRFVPCLEGAVDMAAWAKQQADAARASRLQAAASEAAAEAAADIAQRAAAYYPSAAEALQATEHGQYFQVVENGYVQLYINEGGSAKPLLKLASQESLDRISARPDPLLTSLLF